MGTSYAVSDPTRASNSYWLHAEVDFNESSATSLIVLKARSFVVETLMYIEDAWNGTTPLLSVGSAASNALLINAANIGTTGGQHFTSSVVFDAETVINAYPTHDSSTAGRLFLAFRVIDIPLY